MNGKSKCKILKDIRRKIAEDNDIAYVTSECKYQGECSGTCPKCEAELRYLEEELTKRRNLGKTVAVAGIAAALVLGSAGCAAGDSNQTEAEPLSQDTTWQTQPSDPQPIPGEVPTEEVTLPYEGEITYPEDVLMGDVPYPEEELAGRVAIEEDPA